MDEEPPPSSGDPDALPTDEAGPGPAGNQDADTGPPFSGVLRYFLGLGTWGFGGPIATVGYIQRDLVVRRRWLPERDFLDGVALGQSMPGPLAAQVVMWVGYLRAGAVGALAAAGAFILPSLALVLAVAVVYVESSGLSWVRALFLGISPAVIAIIGIAAVNLARLTDRRDWRLWAISAVTLAVTAATGAEIAWLFVGAGLLIMVWDAPPRLRRQSRAPVVAPLAFFPRGALALGTGGWTGGASVERMLALAWFFLKAGAFIFGSGLAIVPFLREGVVTQHHWLTQRQFLDAVAMGLITPGPVVISATFIGYLVAGFAGAAIATIAIFLPIYLGVVLPGRWFVRHRDHPRLQSFVRGATAAAAGAIGGATLVLAKGAVLDVGLRGPSVPVWGGHELSVAAAAVALGALVAVARFKVKEPIVVVVAGALGLLLTR
jgi:chromate transporter